MIVVENNIKIAINSLAYQGFGVGKHEGKVFFVKGAIPGDFCSLSVKKRKRAFIEAEIYELITPSPNRIEAVCSHFGTCGGCSLQMLDYSQQLLWKKQHVIDCLEHIGKIYNVQYIDTLMSPETYNYRNKMEFSFSSARWLTNEEIQNNELISNKEFALGLHIPGRYDKVLDINECHIQSKTGNKLLELFRTKALELHVTGYNDKEHKGFLRNLIIRNTLLNNETMIILLTAEAKEKNEYEYINWFRNNLKNEIAGINSLVYAVNDTVSPVAQGEIKFVEGSEFIYEEILGLKYRISPFSFFQTNSYQLDRFISKIIEFAGLKKEDIVWDLYCGTGSISLPVARIADKVTGMELIQSSIDDAKINADINNINNVEFIQADLHSKNIPQILVQIEKPDIIIIDPPRGGMHRYLIDHILKIEPDKIIYVSCNPATQARDCNYLSEKYEVIQAQPVDMFPHTFHVESIALLLRK
jgi:23S rRNA (uracil1939-C5)-methyltransferase